MSTQANTHSDRPAASSLPELARGPIARASFTKEYWDATSERRFVLQRSDETGQFQFFPQPISQRGSRRDLQWVEVDPVGEVYAYTITRRGPGPFHGHEPYVVATITLDAGVRVVSNLVDCPLDEIKVGLRVRGTWQPLTDGTQLIVFRPAADTV